MYTDGKNNYKLSYIKKATLQLQGKIPGVICFEKAINGAREKN